MNQTITNPSTIQSETKSSRPALGRGLQEILADQSRLDDGVHHLDEHVKAARIGAAILELVDTVEARYQPIIFQSVAAYRAVANEDSTEEISRKLHELEQKRMEREHAKKIQKRRWYFLYLR